MRLLPFSKKEMAELEPQPSAQPLSEGMKDFVEFLRIPAVSFIPMDRTHQLPEIVDPPALPAERAQAGQDA